MHETYIFRVGGQGDGPYGNRGLQRVETMYFQHSSIPQDRVLNTCDLDAPLRRDFRHTRKASDCPPASSNNVLYAYCTNTRLSGASIRRSGFGRPTCFGRIHGPRALVSGSPTNHFETPIFDRQF